MDAVFVSAAKALDRGEIDFGEFLRRTDRWTGAKARWLCKRLGATPTWLGIEDVEQTVRLHLWLAFRKFDPLRQKGSAPIERYLSFGSGKGTQKMIQRAQGLEQHSRSGPRRFELVGAEDSAEVGFESASAVTPERDVERAQCYEVLRALCETREEVLAITSLEVEGGKLEAAAAALWEDRSARLACRLVNEQHAAQVIDRAVKRLIQDYGSNSLSMKEVA